MCFNLPFNDKENIVRNAQRRGVEMLVLAGPAIKIGGLSAFDRNDRAYSDITLAIGDSTWVRFLGLYLFLRRAQRTNTLRGYTVSNFNTVHRPTPRPSPPCQCHPDCKYLGAVADVNCLRRRIPWHPRRFGCHQRRLRRVELVPSCRVGKEETVTAADTASLLRYRVALQLHPGRVLYLRRSVGDRCPDH